jgi:signal peptidase I
MRIRFRAALLYGVVLLLVGAAWLYLAPSRIGGFTSYVVTHGVSMEPRFHSGDLALVRPADNYEIGDIVAYHSSLLHETVLHRIVAIHQGHYTFKGDNNDFVDPVHPTRGQLVGKLWLHISHGGVVLNGLHDPVVDAALCALLGLFLVWGLGATEQRRRRRRKQTSGSRQPGPSRVSLTREHDLSRAFNFGALLTASAIAAAVFLVLGAFALVHSDANPSPKTTRYSQQVSFGYSAHVTPGPVYAGSVIKTGDPIVVSLVRQLALHIDYSVTGADPGTIKGTEEVVLKLSGPNGWTRRYVLTPATRFGGDHTRTHVTLDLPQLESLLSKIAGLMDTAGIGGFTVAVEPEVHINGAVSGHPIDTKFSPTLTFEPQAGQFIVGSGTPSPGHGGSPPEYNVTQRGGVSSPGTAPAAITVLGASAEVDTLRWIALIGLLLSGGVAVYSYLRKRGEPFQENAHIQSRYGHLIVPIIAGEDLGWPPVDVPNIKALVRLAESGQRLILHNRSGDVDTYMVNDEGTVYRYQVRSSRVVWGEWTDAPVPVDHPTAAAEAA